MAVDLELIDYDVEGVARRDGVIVDGVYLVTRVRRRAVTEPDPALPVPLDTNGKPTVVTDNNGVALRLVSPDGPVTDLRIPLAALPPRRKAAILAAFQTHEDIVLEESKIAYEVEMSSPDALDEKIRAASAAVARVESMRAEEAELDARLAAKRAHLKEG